MIFILKFITRNRVFFSDTWMTPTNGPNRPRVIPASFTAWFFHKSTIYPFVMIVVLNVKLT